MWFARTLSVAGEGSSQQPTTPMEKPRAMRMLSRAIPDPLDAARKGMATLVEETGANEPIVVSDAHEVRNGCVRADR